MTAANPENIGFYAREVKSVIPKEAYKPAYYKLLIMFSYLFIVGLCIVYIKGSTEILFIILASIVAGIALSSLFMYCHEFSHGTIVKEKRIRNILEIFFWSFNYMPATMWRKIHHANHHVNANNYKDPDRRPFKSEKNRIGSITFLLTYPNKILGFAFTTGVTMPVYTWKHILSVFYPKDKKPSLVLFKPFYARKEQLSIAAELLVIIVLQILIAVFISSLSKYLLLTIVSWCVASFMTFAVIMTQHYLNPNYIDSADPLLTTTSTKLPKIFDFILDHTSYHVEHHVIPGINFDYYPIIAKELIKKYPEKYNSLPFFTAVKRAYDAEVFIDDPLE